MHFIILVLRLSYKYLLASEYASMGIHAAHFAKKTVLKINLIYNVHAAICHLTALFCF